MNRYLLTIDGDRIQPIVAEFVQAGPDHREQPDRVQVALGEITLDLSEAAAEDLADAIVDAIAVRDAAFRPPVGARW